MGDIEQKITERAIKIQTELHDFRNNHFSQDEIDYPNLVTAYLINKIATLEVKLELQIRFTQEAP